MPDGVEPSSDASPVAPGGGAASVAARMNDEQITRSAGRGAMWQLLGGGWQTLIRIAAMPVLLRLLNPSDYGILGMALLARDFILIVSPLGMTTGLIAKRDTTEGDLCTVFWTNLGVQLTLFILAELVVAPLAPLYFRDVDVAELTAVMRVVCLTFLFSAMAATSSQILKKRMRFGVITAANAVGSVVEVVLAVALALAGLKYWALVWAMVAAALVTQTAILISARWWPSVRFSREGFRFMFRYGINGLGVSILGYFQYRIDYLIIGRMLGKEMLGFYQNAYQIPHMIYSRLAQPTSAVVFPALAQVQDDDRRLIAGLVKSVRYTSLVVFPALAGLAVLAYPAVYVIMSPKWLPLVLPLRLLCISAAVRCVLVSVDYVFLCKGRPDIPFKIGLVSLAFTLAVVWTMAWLWGLPGVAAGMVIALAPHTYGLHLAFRMARQPIRLLGRALLAPLAAASVCGALALAVALATSAVGAPQWVILVAATAAGAAGYLAAMLVWFPQTLQEVRQTVRLVIGRR